MHKNIIFVGKTGSGKSTVSTMMYNKCVIKEGNLFEISDSAKGITTKCICRTRDGFTIYDTIGLGEPCNGSVPHNKAIELISAFTRTIKFNYICLVKKSERIDILDTKIFKDIKNIFTCDNDKIVLLLTGCNSEWLDKERYSLRQVYGNIPMLTVDFPGFSTDYDLEHIYMRMRTTCLQRLYDWLNKLNYVQCNYIPLIIGGFKYKFTRSTFGSNNGHYIGKVFYLKDKLGSFVITNVDDENAYWYIDKDNNDIKCKKKKQTVIHFMIDLRQQGNILLEDENGNMLNVKVECIDKTCNNTISPILGGKTYIFTRSTFKSNYIGKVFYKKNQPGCFVITNTDDDNSYWYIDEALDIKHNKGKQTIISFMIDPRYIGNIVLSEREGRSMSIQIKEV